MRSRRRPPYPLRVIDVRSFHPGQVRGLHFFGSALLVYNSHRPALLGNRFRYPSASRRALGADAREFDAAAAYGIAPSAADKGLRLPDHPGGDYEIAIPGIWIGRG